MDQILDVEPESGIPTASDTHRNDDHVTDTKMSQTTESLAPDKLPVTHKVTPQVQRRYPERHRVPPKRLDL